MMIENEIDLMNEMIYQFYLNVIPDLFTEKYMNARHHNYIGFKKSDSDYFFVSVLEEPVDGQYRCLKNSKRGFEEFNINVDDVPTKGKSHSIKIEKYLSSMPMFEDCAIHRVKMPGIILAIQSVELKHKQSFTDGFSISLIYCKSDQNNIVEMSENEKSSSFNKFLEFMNITLGKKGIASAKWNQIPISIDLFEKRERYYSR